MKPRNFPARKLQRQIDAKRQEDKTNHVPYSDIELSAIADARNVRTKINRSGQGKLQP